MINIYDLNRVLDKMVGKIVSVKVMCGNGIPYYDMYMKVFTEEDADFYFAKVRYGAFKCNSCKYSVKANSYLLILEEV